MCAVDGMLFVCVLVHACSRCVLLTLCFRFLASLLHDYIPVDGALDNPASLYRLPALATLHAIITADIGAALVSRRDVFLSSRFFFFAFLRPTSLRRCGPQVPDVVADPAHAKPVSGTPSQSRCMGGVGGRGLCSAVCTCAVERKFLSQPACLSHTAHHMYLLLASSRGLVNTVYSPSGCCAALSPGVRQSARSQPQWRYGRQV